VALTEQAEPELRLAGYDYWCQRFEGEVDNFRAALEWALAGGEVTLGVRLASALGLFWYGQGYHVEGFRWIEQLLARLDEVPLIYHPPFLIAAGHMTFLRHDLDAAKPLFLRELDISRELGDKMQIAWALGFLSYTMQREPEAAMPLAEEGLALFRALHHLPGIAQTLNIIGEIARISGDDERAKGAYEQCLAVCQQTGEARRFCYMYYGLSHIAQHESEVERALDLGQRGLRLARERRDANEMANGVAVLAGVFSMLGQAQRAARLLGASEATSERLGAFHHPSDQPEIDRIIAAVRAQLDEEAFEVNWGEGRTIPLEQAVADALDEQG
jgi:non-specific serine/threonine protein kinase